MNVDDLVLECRFINSVTGEVVGYLFRGYMTPSGTICKVALSENKIKSLGMDIASWLQYADADLCEVIDLGCGRYAMKNMAVTYLPDKSDIPYDVYAGEICAYGYIFNKYSYFKLDDSVALDRALGMQY